MSTMVWDETGARYYETGVSKGIFFDANGVGVPWNGLVSVALDPSGGDYEPYYFDGRKYMERTLAEDFQATVQAISTPKEFEPCEGIREVENGIRTHFNKRSKFNMAWRTEIGNDETQALAYKLHIAYNCLVQPSSRNYQTISDGTSMDIRSFVITTTPACGRHSYYTFDSRDGDLTDLETLMRSGTLPRCWELTDLVGAIGSGTSEADCLNLLEDFESYDAGIYLDGDIVTPLTKVRIIGRINNGLDLTDLPAAGAFAANDSAASLVGTGDILADDDDATYITSADGDLGYTIGLPPLVGYVDGVSLELHIRASISGGVNTDDPDNLDADMQVHISTDAAGDLTIGGFSDGADEGMSFSLTDVGGNPIDYVVPLDMDAWVDTTIDDVATALAAGAYLNVVAASNNNFATTPVVRVYEAYVSMLDGTETDNFLRADPWEAFCQVEPHVYDVGTTDDSEIGHSSYIDFLSIPRLADPAGYGFFSTVMENAGFIFKLDMNGGVPRLRGTAYDTSTVIIDASLLYRRWYRIQLDWHLNRVYKVWIYQDEGADGVRDFQEIETATGSTTTMPVATFTSTGVGLGEAAVEKSMETVLDNARIQIYCNEQVPITCDAWATLPLSEMLFTRRSSSFQRYGQYSDGVIWPNPLADSFSDYYNGTFELDPAAYYMFEVTFSATSTHDGSHSRDVYVTGARPTHEDTDFDSSYTSGGMPWANLYYSKIWDKVSANVMRFVIGPGIESWDDATYGPAAGFTRAIIETEDAAVSQIKVMKVCTWIEDEFFFKLDTGVPDGGATLVGAADFQTALSDSSSTSYVNLHNTGSAHQTANLRIVPKDLTAHVWERMWLEFELEVVGGGSSKLDWEISFTAIGNDSQYAGTWNTPATVTTQTLIQTIPLSFNVWPFGGDTGDWNAEFSPENVIYQASRSDASDVFIWMRAYVPNSPAQGDIRIKRLSLKVARPSVT